MKTLALQIEDAKLRVALDAISVSVQRMGGRVLVVGGCVRDAVLGLSAKDLDLEVYGVEPEALIALLRENFELDLVGKLFGVIKLRGLAVDVSIPRREKKAGQGHRGFLIDADPRMSLPEAARRRDFTINAMALDPLTNEIFDPYGGLHDLQNKVLRHTSEQFLEDPLRVLRGMQFAARFDFSVAEETVALCRAIEPEGLARERIFDEWAKLVVKGARPSRGLTFLRDCGWLQHYPELEALIGCEQDPLWHPEGDVWTHTLHCMDAFAARRIGNVREDLIVGFAVLCHDFGKPATTQREGERVTSKGHEKVGEKLADAFLSRMTSEETFVRDVVSLVGAHLRPVLLYKAQAGDAAIRRLARKVGRIDRLLRVSRADQEGRPPFRLEAFPAEDWLHARARALDVEASAPTPIVQGRHLIELGFVPGPDFGRVLQDCYEAQLDGQVDSLEAGLKFAKQRFSVFSSEDVKSEDLGSRGVRADARQHKAAKEELS